MDRIQARSETFETSHENVGSEASFSEQSFEIPKYLSFSHMPPFQFSDLSALDSSLSSEGIEWASGASNDYFASEASASWDVTHVSPLGTSAETRNDMSWTAPIPIPRPEPERNTAAQGWQRCSSVEGCNTLALKTLRTLHVATEDCLSSAEDEMFQMGRRASDGQSHHARTMDAVLSQLKEASAVTTTILKCSCSCFVRIQLQMLVATILEKVVNWCGAIVRSMSTEAGTSGLERREQVLSQSITIGNHQLDKTLEVQVIAQVVMETLKNLEDLVEMLASRIEQESNAGKKGESAMKSSLREAGLLEVVRDKLIECLRSRVGNVRRELARVRENN